VYIYGSYPKIKTGILLFWTTLYSIYTYTHKRRTVKHTNAQSKARRIALNVAAMAGSVIIRETYRAESDVAVAR